MTARCTSVCLMHIGLTSLSVIVAIVGCFVLVTFPSVDGCMASPHPFQEMQPNDVMTPSIMIRGGPMFNYMTDMEGYTVTQDAENFYVYAMMPPESNGSLMPSDMVVGMVDPDAMGLQKGVLPNMTTMMDNCERICDQYDDEGSRMSLSSSLAMPMFSSFFNANTPRKNLVLLVRFSDHSQRQLPNKSDYDILFNSVGGHPTIAPSGSIRDVYDRNSYGNLRLESGVYGWVTLPHTEAYYADGQSGFTDKFLEILGDALDIVDSDPSFDFGHFDADNDGTVDTFTLLHSGYGAEWGSTDSYGQSMYNRVWSHQWSLPSSRHWWSRTGVRVNKYSISPGLWGTSGSEIGRIGVIAHEIGHYLGLPDLYGGAVGNGIGSYGMMANSWGFDGSQRWPPHISAWGKYQVGWTQPTSISSSGRYSIEASATSSEVYRIDLSSSGSEYLLIENRQSVEYDRNMPQGGLAIWHIDQNAGNMEAGFPGKAGWPTNGKHYGIALLQADGNYDLERGNNRGDSGDVFHAQGVSSIGPSESSAGPFPNTDAYQGGTIIRTDIRIFDISVSQHRMEFSVSFGPLTDSPTDYPSDRPTPFPTPALDTPATTKELRTMFLGGNGAAGNMFDVLPLRDIILHGMRIHSRAQEWATVEIWTKVGSYQGFEQDEAAWTRLAALTILTEGMGQGTLLQLSPFEMKSGESQAFYVTTTGGAGLRYTNGQGVGAVISENSDLQIFEGVGKTYPFGQTYLNRRWNGVILYHLEAGSTDSPSASPTESPSQTPTMIGLMPMNEKQLQTTFIGGTQQAGNMFDILAFKNIMITGFDIHVSHVGQLTIDIFTKVDSYEGYETDCDAWDYLASVTVKGQGTGMPSFAPLQNTAFVSVYRYRIQAFYITLRESGMRYTRGSGRGNVVASDANVAVFEGVGKAYPCSSTYFNRIWNGVIHYVAQDQTQGQGLLPSPSPSVGHAGKVTKELSTTFIGGKQAGGNMFDVTANRTIHVTGISLHVKSTDNVMIELYIKEGSYVGFEHNSSAWDKIASLVIWGKGRGSSSQLPPDAFHPIHIAEGETFAIYVTLISEYMRYSSGHGRTEAASNSDVIISKGVGVTYPFDRIYEDRIWNGVLEYTTQQ